MSYDDLNDKIVKIETRLFSLESEVKTMNQLKDDVRFIKDKSIIREEQMSSLASSNLRIEMLLRGDYGADGLIQQFATLKGQVSEHDKKLVWFAASMVTILGGIELIFKVLPK